MATQSRNVSIASHRSRGQNNSWSIKGGTNQVCKWQPRQAVKETQIVAYTARGHMDREVCEERTINQRVKGPLTTEEIESQRMFWIQRALQQARSTNNYKRDMIHLNAQTNQDAWGARMQRKNSKKLFHIPRWHNHLYSKAGEAITLGYTTWGSDTDFMAKVSECHWVPRLRKLTNQVIKSCAGCKWFQAIALRNPHPGPLPLDRTQGSTPLKVIIGVNFAGPLKYHIRRSKTEGKAYIALYSYSLTRAVYLDVKQSLETSEFIRSLKGFIACRGRPMKIYSDNGKTFVGTEKWLKQIMHDEQVQDYLAHQNMKWQFNLSRPSWWGGQFERLTWLVKSSLNKTIGSGMLTWKELPEVMLDAEIAVNSRPLSYVEEEVQQPLLTPNSFLFQRSNRLPELKANHLKDADLCKQARYPQSCKQALWSRWSGSICEGWESITRWNTVRNPHLWPRERWWL